MHSRPLILASASRTRRSLLERAGVETIVEPAFLDEAAMVKSLRAEGFVPRAIAEKLAEAKAHKVASRHGDALVLGCDQVLDFAGEVLEKVSSITQARARLLLLRGQEHRLWTAAVLFDGGVPVWREVAQARLRMRNFSDSCLEAYLDKAQDVLFETAGCYAVEGLGLRLFEMIEGDFFGILGLPLLPLLRFLTDRGDLSR